MKEFFEKYKVTAYLLYSLIFAMFLVFWGFTLLKLLLFIPLAALGAYILFKVFPRPASEQLTMVSVNGGDSVLITKLGIMRSIKDACVVIEDSKYISCEVENSRTGLNIIINIKVLYNKIVETSELVKAFVKCVLEEELNVKVNKIDIIVKKAIYNMRVKKLSDTPKPADDKAWAKNDKKLIEEADRSSIRPLPEAEGKYSFSVGREEQTYELKLKPEKEAVKPSYAFSAVGKPIEGGKTSTADTSSKSKVEELLAERRKKNQSAAAAAPASSVGKRFDLAAEIAKRRAEREAFSAGTDTTDNTGH